jgi:hypothetical protein
MFAHVRRFVLLASLAATLTLSQTASVQAGPMTSDVQAMIIPPPLPPPPPTPVFTNATAAAGAFPGNDKPTDLLNRLNNQNLFSTGLTTWTLIGSSDDPNNGPFTSNPSATSGQILLDNPINGPFVIAVKGGDSYAAYYFDSSFSNVLGFLFTTAGLDPVGSGNQPNLSHMSLYMPQGGTGGGGGTGDPIPAPGTLVVFGLMLGAVGWRQWRARRQAQDGA